ncbi:hypothetical protein SAMN05443287_112111 [Micromonospora phaseoli]|uniref:Uncharacterized protein n=1 Tax=Micromonospora phaseoli TaxID=1144548 RepID=A0A1H7DBH2_9ACTN|nr:hypothetical protein CLV64_112112 [Micromonospora phaseoli]GIJ77440.1 hypothetical protein Xph01_18720 [Micromonospora phaseoli]SEJ98237.1 hypothetical protein SAMN05443287_112111 [Micromonospora phaseoli]
MPPAILELTVADPPGPRPGVRRAAVPGGLLDPTAGNPLEEEDLTGSSAPTDEARRGAARRRRLTLAGLSLTAVASAVMLVAALVNWAPDGPPPRPMNSAEQERLAAMRVTNLRDLRAGLHVTVGDGNARTDLLGWVDWARQLVYLDVGGPGAGALRGLAQATPTVLVVRPDPTAMPTPATPPLVPPADGWRLPADRGLDPLLLLVFGLAADRPEPTGGPSGRWLGREQVNGETVDILEAAPPGTVAPATGTPGTAAPATGPPGATTGGSTPTRYWVDLAGRLHRLEASLPGVGPVTVALNRADRPTLRPVEALGGRPGLPRALNAAERDRWRRLPARLRAAGGATVTVTGPVSGASNLRGAGWLSWTSGTAYLGVADLDPDGRRTLVRHHAGKVTRIENGAPGSGTARPPLPPPTTGWRTGPHRTQALDPLLEAALRAAKGSGPQGDVRRVRGDTLAGTTVDVVQLKTARGPVRYWVDRSGLLRRLELPTRAGAWAQLDLDPGRVPRLTPPRAKR